MGTDIVEVLEKAQTPLIASNFTGIITIDAGEGIDKVDRPAVTNIFLREEVTLDT